MTTKDYGVLADAIRREAEPAGEAFEYGSGEREAIEAVAESIAVALKRDNPRFDRAVFMDRALGYCPDPSLDYTTLEANSR